MREGRSIAVQGIVQGVGFRPWVHGLAAARRLGGRIRNDASGVRIEVEGETPALESFLEELARRPPPLARIHRMRVRRRPPRGWRDFRIQESRGAEERAALVPPDTATCDDCLRELFDPADRRFRYPFLNCTRCGPRLTIVRDLPYDRPRTTMAGFPMCEACRREYEDPADRRFHAQPTACPACGPRLRLYDPEGRTLAAAGASDPLRAAVAALLEGRIVAVKGLGGWHLACDARRPEAVRRLRARKRRPTKPLAVMVRDVSAARALCELGPAEEGLLVSARRPIVLLRKRPRPTRGARAPGGARLAEGVGPDGERVAEGVGPGGERVAEEVAPGTRRLGVMLPYTPLHHLLAAEAGRPLVMTSGNRTDEPIAIRDEDARARLADIADLFLGHDRPIETRCDDSVWRVLAGGPVPLRRSRGWAPQPVRLPVASPAPLLAVGGQQKNAFCLVRGDRAFPSPHVGDLGSPEAIRAFREGIARYQRLLGIRPAAVAHDLHPAYASTGHAAALEGLERIGVQHHHAHVAGCLAEHGERGPAIGIAFDGTGYGEDETVWGGEVLVADLEGYRRAAHLGTVPLPGGEAAVRQPWRMAAAHLAAAFGGDLEAPDAAPPAARLRAAAGAARWEGVLQLLDRPALSPRTSSVGRLFDAVAALLGLADEARFEGEAAIALEMACDPDERAAYPVAWIDALEGPRIWDPAPIVRRAAADLRGGTPPGAIAARFHGAVRDAAVAACRRVREQGGPELVALTGGCFQNARLTEATAAALEAEGFRVLLHRRLPPNDGGLAYGQAAVAAARLAARAARNGEPAAGPARAGTKKRSAPSRERGTACA